MIRYLTALVLLLAGLSLPCPAESNEPGWVGQVIKPIAERDEIRQTPIIHRPYRPLHVYGNTVRRIYYHGRILPAPGELGESLEAMAGGR